MSAAEPDRDGRLQSIYLWTVEIKNVGSVEYDVFPAAQMYVSTITLPTGADLDGVWGASLAAAEEAGLTPNYEATDIRLNETKTFTLAASSPSARSGGGFGAVLGMGRRAVCHAAFRNVSIFNQSRR
jgi:hypothetical protein